MLRINLFDLIRNALWKLYLFLSPIPKGKRQRPISYENESDLRDRISKKLIKRRKSQSLY